MIRVASGRSLRRTRGNPSANNASGGPVERDDLINWNASTWWWIVAGLLVAGELATGTFYVLMVAIGCVAGALASYASPTFALQAIVAAVIGGGAVVIWHRQRPMTQTGVAPAANRDINLDVGESVHVEAWNPDGTARIQYRGSGWNARYIGAGVPAPGVHVIAEVRHNELALRRPE
jgi:membrane protein implicated in regulation of membrane protease activity